ncbi:MAG: hypothetical protein NXI32_30325, partial [bacterium]|nr:hypothetical protein [bacterium]
MPESDIHKNTLATELPPGQSRWLLELGLAVMAMFFVLSSTVHAQTAIRLAGTGGPKQPSTAGTAALASSSTRVKLASRDELSRRDEWSRNEWSGDLKQILGNAMRDLDASRLPSLDQARANLEKQLAVVEAYIRPETSNGQAWSRFLKLDQIREALNQPNPSEAELAQLEMNLRQNYPGLESNAITGLRDALVEFKHAARYGGNPERTIQVFEARIQALVASLDQDAAADPAKLAEDVGRIVNYLYTGNQSPDAIQQLRSKFNRANAEVYANESMLNRVASRAVAEPSPVDECILGTRVLGRACLQGSVGLDLLPMYEGISLKLNLTGNLTSQNRGYNRGVVLRTTGNSPIFASKQILVTTDGITSSPATVATDLTTTIQAIEHKLRIVRKIARRKAAEQKPQADAIAQGRMQNRIRTQYDAQVEERLSEARGQLTQLKAGGELETKLERFDMPQPAIAFYSTSDAVNANVVQAASFQLAASEPCPLPRPADSQVVIQIHQSLLINALESFLSDRTVRNTDVDDLAQQIAGEVPQDLQSKQDEEPWEITMVGYNPVQIDFDDDRVKLTLRFTRMAGSDEAKTITGGAVVTVVYEPRFQSGRLELRRVGDIDIQLPGIRSQNRATVLRSAARAKLDPVFQEE